MFPLFFLAGAVVATVIHLVVSKKPKTQEHVLEVLVMYLIFFSVGLESLFAASGHIFAGPKIAKEIGWAPGSPFQFEVAMAAVGMGVAGILSLWFKKGFWLATVLITAIFLWGDAYGHFVQHALGDNSPYNWGIFLFAGDIGIPIIYTALTCYYYFKYAHPTESAP